MFLHICQAPGVILRVLTPFMLKIQEETQHSLSYLDKCQGFLDTTEPSMLEINMDL